MPTRLVRCAWCARASASSSSSGVSSGRPEVSLALEMEDEDTGARWVERVECGVKELYALARALERARGAIGGGGRGWTPGGWAGGRRAFGGVREGVRAWWGGEGF